MNYHNITKDDMNNGDGLRVVLWVAGCEHHCQGCQNPCTWDKDTGLLFDKSAKKEIFEQLKQPYISGITFSGGDPLAVYNRNEVFAFMKEIKAKFPDKTIWCYTGYTLPELNEDPETRIQLLTYVDVLVDGKFIEELKDVSYHWAGSTNQNIFRNVEGNFIADEKKFTKLDESYSETCSCCS